MYALGCGGWLALCVPCSCTCVYYFRVLRELESVGGEHLRKAGPGYASTHHPSAFKRGQLRYGGQEGHGCPVTTVLRRTLVAFWTTTACIVQVGEWDER